MFKRLFSLVICAVMLLLIIPLGSSTLDASAEDYGFDDRILYGGTAVDIGENTVFSQNGGLYYRFADGKITEIAKLDAKYLNWFDSRLWFVSQNKIISCLANGSDMVTVRVFEGESVSHLYVLENEILYLRGRYICSLVGGVETKLLYREGIKGFVPQSKGVFRYIVNNPDYEYTEESGDEVWEEGTDEYLSYVAVVGTDREDDTKSVSVYSVSAQTTGSYTGPSVKIGNVTLPLEEHMPGTYFSKNGKACTCHNTSSTYCIQSVGNCNCMRYYPTGYKETCEVDLLGAQCFAFSRMIFYTCFGFIDHSDNASLYYSVGTLARGAVTENSVKNLLMKAAPGAHIRLAAGHSVSILTMDEDFIVIYHGNAGGDGVASSPCIVSTRRYTWAQFANAAAAGILYVNMPYNYPDSSIILTEKQPGYYKLKANLNLRAETNTQSQSIAVIPNGTMIEVTEISGFWGKTIYGGNEGWVFLEYTTFFSSSSINPSGELFKRGDDGYLRAAVWKLNFDLFSEYFDKQNITVTSPSGEDLSSGGYISTGALVSLKVNGELIDEAYVCLAGDVNRNGLLDVGDYLAVRRAYLGTFELSDAALAAADVSGNGSLDTTDYALIKRYFLAPNESYFASFGKNRE